MWEVFGGVGLKIALRPAEATASGPKSLPQWRQCRSRSSDLRRLKGPQVSGFHHHGDRPRWQMFVPVAAYGALVLLAWFYRDALDALAKDRLFGVHPVAVLVLLGGYQIFREAVAGLLKLRISADLAVAIAAVAALVIGENFAAAEVIFIMLIGGGLEELAVDRTERSIRRIVELAPDVARVRRDGREVEVAIGDVGVGATVVVRPGERVAVDGEVSSGRSSVNQATITGEPMAVEKGPGDEVHAGTLNESGALEVRVTRVGEDTTLARIARLVEEAKERKGQVQHRADRWAVWFVPVVLVAAVVTYLVTKQPIRAVAVLVVACPCALVLATPTAIVAAIGRLAREGMLVRGGAHIEALARADVVAFDKTGTVTRGEPRIVAVDVLGDLPVAEVLRLAAAVERPSEHAFGRLIVAYAEAEGVDATEVDDFQAHAGRGVEGVVDGRRVWVGKAPSHTAPVPGGGAVSGETPDPQRAAEYRARGAMLAWVSVDGEAVGLIAAEDQPREEAREAVALLSEAGIEETLLLTGDHEQAARTVRDVTGLGEVHADLLPQEKAEIVERLEQAGKSVVAVGDGVNDAPMLATASVGVAMGDVATDVTADAADVILATADLRQVPAVIRFSRRTMKTIGMNVFWFAALFNGIGVALSAKGLLGPIGAAVYHQIASLLVVGNSLRLLAAGRLEERGRVAGLGLLAGDTIHRLQHWVEDIRWGRIAELVRGRRAWLRRWGPVIVVAAYLASGLYTVRPSEVAVVRRFGAQHGAPRGPGLHYRAPWPVDRVTKLKPELARVVEVGYRTLPGGEEAGGYEWENPHESGAYERQAEESLRITGDENVLDVNVSVQYRIAAPHEYLFHVFDEQGLARAVAEQAVRDVIGRSAADDALTGARRDIEGEIAAEAGELFALYESGLEVVQVRLLDVHPPIQVVPAYREVASAMEEKRTVVDQAEAYRNERLPQAKGQAAALKLGAEAWARTRREQAKGDAARFRLVEQEHRRWAQVTEIRMHLDAVEKALDGKRKLILGGKGGGKRQMWLIDSEGLRMKGGAPVPLPEPTYPVFGPDEENAGGQGVAAGDGTGGPQTTDDSGAGAESPATGSPENE